MEVIGVMYMLVMSENATDVRKNWSDFIDAVTNEKKPTVVARNNKNPFLSISLEQVATLLTAYQFHIEIEHEEDGTVSVDLQDFDLFANDATLDQALSNLADELIDYAHDYLNDIQLYYNSPNRKKHLPYVLQVLLQENKADVVKLLHADV